MDEALAEIADFYSFQQNLLTYFYQADADGDGMVSPKELDDALKDMNLAGHTQEGLAKIIEYGDYGDYGNQDG